MKHWCVKFRDSFKETEPLNKTASTIWGTKGRKTLNVRPKVGGHRSTPHGLRPYWNWCALNTKSRLFGPLEWPTLPQVRCPLLLWYVVYRPDMCCYNWVGGLLAKCIIRLRNPNMNVWSLFIFVVSFFLSNTHNSITIQCMQTFYNPNQCSNNGNIFLVRAA